MELAPGTILLGKYRIDELIGSGGMGNVVRASHLYLHQPVAIKLLLPELAASASTVQRFLREAQATVKLRSEHIARVTDVGTTPEGVPFMVMEYLDGNDLNQILRHHGPQQPAIVVDLMLQACEGIAEAHALGIIHRDVKPSNFFVTRRPDGSMLLKILDFGISKTPVGYGELTGTQTVIGTPSYMAPEQMKSGRSADPRSDLWSIGVVMYQLVTGRLPFSGESYADLVLKVGLEPPAPLLVPLPPGLDEVLLRCLEKDPAARHQNVGELARVLAPYASDPVSAAQSAGRTLRTLQQRGSIQGVQGSPLTANGGLSVPIPISPAQLTPRGWPHSQVTSLSQGAGQVTFRARTNRGWLIAGVAGLCVAAGGGGYAISQLSKADPGAPGPHVQAPPPRTTEPSPSPMTAAAAVAAQASAPSAAGNAADPATTGATAPATPPGAAAAPGTGSAGPQPGSPPQAGDPRSAVAGGSASAADRPPSWRPTTPAPTFPEHDAAAADGGGSGKVATDAARSPDDPDGKPTSATLIDSKPPIAPTTARPADARPGPARPSRPSRPADARPSAARPTDAKPSAARPTEAKPSAAKPSKPGKPSKPADDLFDSRH